MWKKGETAHVAALGLPWHEPKRIQKEIRILNEDSFGGEIAVQSGRPVCKKEGIAREAAEIY